MKTVMNTGNVFMLLLQAASAGSRQHSSTTRRWGDPHGGPNMLPASDTQGIAGMPHGCNNRTFGTEGRDVIKRTYATSIA